jgi:hypothetical protein
LPQSPANLQTSRGARYQPVVVATTAEKVLNGLVQTEPDAYVELIDAKAKLTRVPKSEIDEHRVGEVMLMPAGLVDRAHPYEILARQRSTNRR